MNFLLCIPYAATVKTTGSVCGTFWWFLPCASTPTTCLATARPLPPHMSYGLRVVCPTRTLPAYPTPPPSPPATLSTRFFADLKTVSLDCRMLDMLLLALPNCLLLDVTCSWDCDFQLFPYPALPLPTPQRPDSPIRYEHRAVPRHCYYTFARCHSDGYLPDARPTTPD